MARHCSRKMSGSVTTYFLLADGVRVEKSVTTKTVIPRRHTFISPKALYGDVTASQNSSTKLGLLSCITIRPREKIRLCVIMYFVG